MPCHNLSGIVTGKKMPQIVLIKKNDCICWEGETKFEYEEGNLGENINI
jgi:hypothetical protein